MKLLTDCKHTEAWFITQNGSILCLICKKELKPPRTVYETFNTPTPSIFSSYSAIRA